jgi:hypothetical protein
MFECTELQKLRSDLLKATTPKERVVLLAKISNHKQSCEICSGRYQVAGVQQLRDQAFAGTWGKGER